MILSIINNLWLKNAVDYYLEEDPNLNEIQNKYLKQLNDLLGKIKNGMDYQNAIIGLL